VAITSVAPSMSPIGPTISRPEVLTITNILTGAGVRRASKSPGLGVHKWPDGFVPDWRRDDCR